MSRFPIPDRNSQSYYVNHKFAGYTGNPLLDGFNYIVDSAKGTSNLIQQSVGGEANRFQTDTRNGINKLIEANNKGDQALRDRLGNPGDQLNKVLSGTAGHPGDGSKNPTSNCINCGTDWWNPGQWSCVVQKAACEGASGANRSFGDLGQYLPYIAIGGSVILLIVLMKK